ncbi:hypothetical protein [Nocardia thailandica]
MVTSAPEHARVDGFGADTDVPSWKLGAEGAPEDELAPLGIPATVVAGGLILAGLAVLAAVPAWVDDYGLLLIATAYGLHMALAIALGAWGIAECRRARARENSRGVAEPGGRHPAEPHARGTGGEHPARP